MPRSIAFVVFLLTCSGFAFAQGVLSPKSEQGERVVREFCRLDYLGNRLSPEGWAQVKPLTTWNDNPAWRTFMVVSRYDQTDASAASHSVKVTVRYLPLGRFELGIGYTPMKEPQDAQFTAKQSGEDKAWRIDSTDPDVLVPHISKAAAVRWLQDKLKSDHEPTDKLTLENALKALQPSP